MNLTKIKNKFKNEFVIKKNAKFSMKAASIGVAYRLSQSTDLDDAYILNEHEPLPDNPLKKVQILTKSTKTNSIQYQP